MPEIFYWGPLLQTNIRKCYTWPVNHHAWVSKECLLLFLSGVLIFKILLPLYWSMHWNSIYPLWQVMKREQVGDHTILITLFIVHFAIIILLWAPLHVANYTNTNAKPSNLLSWWICHNLRVVSVYSSINFNFWWTFPSDFNAPYLTT